jgi:hypothetical protein
MAAFGLPGGAELAIIFITVLIILGPTLTIALVIWLVAKRRPASASHVPATWAADPSGRHELRYWNGTSWTVHVSDAGVQSEDPLGA